MKKPGYALATILILLGVALFSVGAVVTISTLESKIARSQEEGTTAYYVAEAGVQDGLWRLNNNSSYASALVNGTLNVSYTATDFPATGEGFTVTMTSTAGQPAGNGTVDVIGTSNNGSFTAQRHIRINVFKGVTSGSIGQNAFFAGGAISVTNKNTVLQLTNGGVYAGGNINISQATVNAGTYPIETAGSYSTNSGATVTSGGIYASNFPPAPTALATPSFDFSYYSTNYTVRYTPTDFQNLVTAGGSTITLPGPVTYIDGNLALGNWAKNKTINVTGLFIIAGTFSINGTVSNFNFNVTDPGTGKAGIFVQSNANTNISNGAWNVQGVVYASGSISFTSNQATTINGALVSGGTVNVNTGLSANLSFNSNRVDATLGASTPSAVEVQHWEEQY